MPKRQITRSLKVPLRQTVLRTYRNLIKAAGSLQHHGPHGARPAHLPTFDLLTHIRRCCFSSVLL